MLAWYIFYFLFAFNLCLYIWKKFIVDNTDLSCYFIQSDNFCLLIGVFRQLSFNVSMSMFGLKCIICNLFFYLSNCSCYIFLFSEETFIFILIHIICLSLNPSCLPLRFFLITDFQKFNHDISWGEFCFSLSYFVVFLFVVVLFHI